MSDSVQIVGQGIAGSMLGWACEQNAIPFRIWDPGNSACASRVGAGLISPLTGQRLVPTWRFAAWRDEVLGLYRRLESELQASLVREFRIRRLFRDSEQRARFLMRIDRPEVAPWVERVQDNALILRGAIQVDTRKLVDCLRSRWIEKGWLVEREWTPEMGAPSNAVIWCTGASAPPGAPIAWEPSRGEVLRGRLPGLSSTEVLNNGHWMFSAGESDEVLVGAIFDRENLEAGVTPAGQAELAAAAKAMTGLKPAQPVGRSGLRVNVPDRRPVVGWWSANPRQGVFSGLAAKGALWAPMLAQQWAADGLRGKRIDPEARVARFRGPGIGV